MKSEGLVYELFIATRPLYNLKAPVFGFSCAESKHGIEREASLWRATPCVLCGLESSTVFLVALPVTVRIE